ncbi:unnamed protein product [Phyllotreta striolata]|uniref:Enhancer of split mbeta protein-like n=1 Tax=Phyllotreta striolata TaxID=444603 RepID=A0A9N9TI27_PHYSR|nr:unnamed protein product [Phyllotreta striolata]
MVQMVNIFKKTIFPSTMAPPYGSDPNEEPISRTYQYRKVMKPMLERKRRARINRCLDELKELMVTALQNEGENVSKLEKADILELTVRHLHTLKNHRQLAAPAPAEQGYADRFRAGFAQCAQEVTHFVATPTDGVDPTAGRKLLQHLGACVRRLDYASRCCEGKDAGTPAAGQVWRPWSG